MKTSSVKRLFVMKGFFIIFLKIVFKIAYMLFEKCKKIVRWRCISISWMYIIFCYLSLFNWPLYGQDTRHWDNNLKDKCLQWACCVSNKRSLYMKRSFFQATVVSILLYGCTTWMLTKRLEKKLDGNYTRMLRATLNKSWRQHPTKHQ